MSLRATFAENYKAGNIKINPNPAEVKAAAEKLSKLPKDELEKMAEDPIGLLREVGVHLDDQTAEALMSRINAARSGEMAMAAVIHIDV